MQTGHANSDLSGLSRLLAPGYPALPPSPLSQSMPVLRSSAALLALGLLVLMPQAHALSKRDQAAVDALNQRMQAAETRYRQGLVKIGNADPAGRTEVD